MYLEELQLKGKCYASLSYVCCVCFYYQKLVKKRFKSVKFLMAENQGRYRGVIKEKHCYYLKSFYQELIKKMFKPIKLSDAICRETYAHGNFEKANFHISFLKVL